MVSYRALPPKEPFDLSQTQDLSAGGVMLTTPKRFPPGTLLELTLKLPFVAERVKLEATVVACREVIPNMLYRTHLCFHQLDKAFFKDLAAFIRKQLGQ